MAPQIHISSPSTQTGKEDRSARTVVRSTTIIKSTSFISAAIFALATAFTVPAAEAATKPDFSDLKGRYKGNGTVVIGSESGAGSVNLNVKVPRSGRSAEIIVFGSIVANGSTLPVFGRINLSGRRLFQVNSLLFSLEGLPGAQGTYKALRNRTTFSAPWTVSTTTGTILGDVAVPRNGRRIQLNYTLIVDGSAEQYVFTFKANRKGK